MSRDYILHKVRTALGRSVDQPPPPAPSVRISIPSIGMEAKIDSFCRRLEALAGKIHRAESLADARDYVDRLVAGRQAVASNALLLYQCGVTALPTVPSGLIDREEVRALCSNSAGGVTHAECCAPA